MYRRVLQVVISNLRWLFFAPVTAEPSVLWEGMPNSEALEYKPFRPCSGRGGGACDCRKGAGVHRR